MNLQQRILKIKSGRLYRWLLDHHIPVQLLLAVIAGIVVSKVATVLSHLLLHHLGILPALADPVFDTGLLLIELFIHSFFAVAGAIVTAWLAGKDARRAAFVLGTKEAIIWLLGLILLWHHYPPWFNLAKAVLGIPLALLGGRIYIAIHNNRAGKSSLR